MNYPPDWSSRKDKIKRKYDWECQICGLKGGPKGDSELHVHHILPICKGGGHGLSNLTLLCDQCHSRYHDNPKLKSNGSGYPLIDDLMSLLTFNFAAVSDSVERRKRRRNNLKTLRQEELRLAKEKYPVRSLDQFQGTGDLVLLEAEVVDIDIIQNDHPNIPKIRGTLEGGKRATQLPFVAFPDVTIPKFEMGRLYRFHGVKDHMYEKANEIQAKITKRTCIEEL